MQRRWLVGFSALALGCVGAGSGGPPAGNPANSSPTPTETATTPAPQSDARVEPAIGGDRASDDALGSLDGKMSGGGGGGEGYLGLADVGDGQGKAHRHPTAPSVKVGDSAVTGALTKEEIRHVIKRNFNRIRYCYEKELVAEPKLAGKATTKFTIGPDGKVVSAEVQGFGSTSVDTCLQKVISAMEFPQPKGGGVVVVTYPFVFSTADAVSDPSAEGSANDGK